MSEYGNGFACEAGADDFTATAHRGGKGGRRVTVKGTCACRTPGYRLKLTLASPPFFPNELHLELTEEPPTGTVTQVITPTDVEGEFDIGDEVERVVIVNRDITVLVKEG
ncbi:hypothetical protein ADK53_19765 [Streptomyces sp. WM6373]|uniref:hypothetical protein n=1 Tax=Streptomyces TaxID=1883 RepID=UPI0006AE3F14|nr:MULTISPECIES: hypothetical protein [unclassified Streptomyces]KOU33174.1 hypothetical protein ADK53_19765 [Streptomyces sp. WM6373]KOU64394.1 hypothetical protein ADK96_21645 [Streptomyces sp. IGB124]KOV34124.1 hypothetical protein ADK97_16325 [Streptomyces sp. H021]KOV47671.1 hypothetical protein ADK99_18825 [Streptomyces sp. MMG1064]